MQSAALSTRRDAGGSNPPLSIAPSGDGRRTTQLNVVIIHYAITTDSAVYQFQVNTAEDQARITRWILKGQRGVHASTSMSVGQARKLAKQLQVADAR